MNNYSIPDSTRVRLRQVLLLLSSDKPGEIVAAAYAIGRALRAAGMDWHAFAQQLTEPKQTTVLHVDDDDNEEEWREAHAFCQRHAHLLRPREREFLDDLEDWVGGLTPKQSDWLNGLSNRLRRRSR